MDVGLLFGMIFAIIVMGFVVFFGYRYVTDMACIQGDSTTAQQIINLEKSVQDTFSLSMGSSKDFQLMVGACSGKICFLNPASTDSNPESGWETNNIFDELIQSNNYNIFVLDSSGNYKDGRSIKNMKPAENFCISSAKNLLLTNKGRYVSISIL
jgi:hypothetical protein